MPLNLPSIVPWGRSFDEYRLFFSLTDSDLNRNILDCAAGPSSFNAGMTRLGHRVTSIDPLYHFTAAEIQSRIDPVRQSMLAQVRRQPRQFVWDYIRSPEHLDQIRTDAMQCFLSDYATDPHHQRYLPQSLPTLDFPAHHFDLALCSHFLFLYSTHLDEPFHVASIRELLRVAREVRIFPITDLAGRPSPHLPAIQRAFQSQLRPVPYEFLRGANQVLHCSASKIA